MTTLRGDADLTGSSATAFRLRREDGGNPVRGADDARLHGDPDAHGEQPLVPTGIDTSALGEPTITVSALQVTPTSITTGEAFDGVLVAMSVVPFAIAPPDVPTGIFASLMVAFRLRRAANDGSKLRTAFPTWPAAIRAPQEILSVMPESISPEDESDPFVPDLEVTGGAVSCIPTGIDTSGAFGTLKVSMAIIPTAIASAEAFGTIEVVTLPAMPTGIASAGALGTPTVTAGVASVVPDAIASSETFGTITVNASDAPEIFLVPIGIESAEALGSDFFIAVGDGNVVPDALASSEALGDPSITYGAVSAVPDGVATEVAFGVLSVSMAIELAAIESEEALGTLRVGFIELFATPTAIPWPGRMGQPTATGGDPIVITGAIKLRAHLIEPIELRASVDDVDLVAAP